MNKRFYRQMSLGFRVSVFFICILILLVVAFGFFYIRVASILTHFHSTSGFIVQQEQTLLIQIVILAVFLSGFITTIYFRRSFLAINKINKCLQEALEERNLALFFSDYFKGRTFDRVASNTQFIFDMFKTFDNMKIGRISQEMNSLKILINNINEGIVLLTKDRIVTHINHPAETMLRLIPGEIIDQAISRKISNKVLLDNLDLALEKGQKVMDVEAMIKEDTPLNMHILPVKNKFGDIVRAMIILEPFEIKS